MKKQLKLLMMIMFIAGMGPLVAKASILDGYIGENFQFDLPTIYTHSWSTDKSYDWNKMYPSHRDCNNSVAYGILYFHGMLQYDTGKTKRLGIVNDYINRGCRLKSGYEIANEKTLFEQGEKLQQQLYADPMLSKVEQFLTFGRLSNNGTSIDAILSLIGEPVTGQTISGKLRFGLQLAIGQCIDPYGKVIELYKTKPDEQLSIRKTIGYLRSLSRAQMERCVLHVTGFHQMDPTEETYRKSKMLAYGWNTGFSVIKDNPLLLSHFYQGVQNQVGVLRRVGDAIDPHATQQALHYRSLFISLLSDNYGDLLYSLSSDETISISEKTAAIQAFFKQNGPTLVSYLEAIEAEFSKTSLMTKINIVRSIQQTYMAIEEIENEVANGSPMNLDRYIKSQL